MTPYYEEDGITIYHGDCVDVLPSLGVVPAIVTDPPYGQGNKVMHPSAHGKWLRFWKDGGPEWNAAPPAVVDSFPRLAETCIIWGGNHFALPPARGWLVWDKIVRNFSSSHCELAWTTLNQPVRAFNYANPWLHAEDKHHPTQKPLPVMRWCLSFIDAPIVVDPFAGVGTTLLAAKELGKQAIGIEIEENYCEIAAQRLSQGVLAL